MIEAIRDRKIVFLANGLNIGNASGTVQDLAPLLPAMMGQTTVMVNGLNLGSLNAPRAAKPSSDADVDGVIRGLEAAIGKKPSAESYCLLGEAWKAKGSNANAAAAYKKALELQPDYFPAQKCVFGSKQPLPNPAEPEPNKPGNFRLRTPEAGEIEVSSAS